MLKNYLKIAYKVLLRQKFFTFVSLFGISMTLTVLFVAVAMLDTVFTPGGRGSKLSRVLYVEEIRLQGKDWSIHSNPSYKLLDQHVRALKTPEAASIHSSNTSTTVYVGGRKVELQLKYTDAAFWDIVEFNFTEGGAYSKGQVDNVDAVAVITDRTRDEVFGPGPVMGKTIETTAGNFRVGGVVPLKAMPGHVVYADIWVPITQNRQAMDRTELYGSELAIVLPARDGDIGAIKKEYEEHLNVVRGDLDERFDSLACPMATQVELAAAQFADPSVGGPTLIISIIIGLMILFMLLPAINLVNMNVSRIFERSSEIGVRKAFGASASTLIGQFVVENVVLTLAGGALAVILSLVALHILNDSGVLPDAYFKLNIHVLLAVEGMKAGAADFITKPWNSDRLLQAIRTALSLSAHADGGREGQSYDRRQLNEIYSLDNVIGAHDGLLAVPETAGRVSATDAPVLIIGQGVDRRGDSLQQRPAQRAVR